VAARRCSIVSAGSFSFSSIAAVAPVSPAISANTTVGARTTSRGFRAVTELHSVQRGGEEFEIKKTDSGSGRYGLATTHRN
jgi:hypothetical protein